MKLPTMLCATLALLTCSSAAQAQTTIYWPAPATAQQGQQKISYFPMGTPITLTTRTELSTKSNKPGDRFYLEVAESLSYRGQIVVPVGSHAVGEVMRAEKNGHFGKKGKLDIRLLYIETPYGPVRLSGRANKNGRSGTLVAASGTLLVSPLFFFVHGTSGRIAADTPVTAYLADDLRFAAQPQAVAQENAVQASPDQPRALPARFDPSVFSLNSAK